MASGENIRKVKIVVLGDTGVGKSSFVNQLCHKEALTHHVSTVGCCVEVKLHEYTHSISSTPISFFVEVWDMGSSANHAKGRKIFYPNTNGVILVHDLTNRKSYNNLKTWLSEFYDGMNDQQPSAGRSYFKKSHSLEYDAEQFADLQVPMLVVGTKEDQVSGRKSPHSTRGSDISAAINVSVDNRDATHFSCNSQRCVDITKFIDKVVDHKYYPKRESASSSRSTSGSSISRRHPLNPYN